jgi:arginyl-tRNA synthetase
MTTINDNKQKQLYQEIGKYNQLSKEEQQVYWQKKQEEYEVMSPEEKKLWTKATDGNLLEIKQHLLSMRQRIDLLKSTTTV